MVTLTALASTSVGVTWAIFSNRPTGETNTFVAGTVSLSNNVAGACTVATSSANNMVPSGTATCTLATTYSGTLPGFMAVDVFIATKKDTTAGGGSATNLYNPGDGNTAQITVSSTTPTVSSYAIPTTSSACPASGLDGVNYSSYHLCYLLSNVLVATTAFTSASPTVTFTTTVYLPTAQPNTYQGSSAVVVLAAHAVQSTGNAINCTAGGTSPTAGAVCTPAGTFSWG